jgi:hypothetical protein
MLVISIFALLAVFVAVMLLRKDDGLKPIQRDISKSLEKAKGLKEERDCLRAIEHQRRFPKADEEAEVTSQNSSVQNATLPSQKKMVESDGQVSAIPVTHQEVQVPKSAPVTHNGPGATIPAERFFTTAKMDGLTPQGRQAQFNKGASVYAYAGVHAPGAEQIRMDWIGPADQVLSSEVINVEVNTGINGYRVFKYRTFQQAGRHEVRLYNQNEVLIGTSGFIIVD